MFPICKPLIFCIVFSMLLSFFASASTFRAPEGFESFLFDTEKVIKIKVEGSKDEAMVPANVAYDSFRINSIDENVQEIKELLRSSSLSEDAIKLVLHELNQGVSSDKQCERSLSECMVKPFRDQVHYVFDYDNDLLRLFVSPSVLDVTNPEVEYLPSLSSSNALINSSNLTASTDFDGRERFTLGNKTLLGLPYGFLDFDTQYSSSNDEFSAYKYFYNFDHEDFRFQLGGTQRTLSLNSTGFLNKRQSAESIGAYFGSSRNLIKGDTSDVQRIYFQAPNNGVLEVYRDDELLLSKSVSQGQQYISYAELPSGAYQVRLVLSVGGFEVMNEVQQVVNTQQFDLAVGDFDYLVAGERISQLYGLENEVDAISGALSYRATESVLLAAGLMYSPFEMGYQLGVDYYWRDALNINYTFNGFDSGAIHQTASINFSPFFVDFRYYSQGDDDFNDDDLSQRLSVAMYGYQEFLDVGVGVSGSIGNGSAYLRYSYIERGNQYYTQHYNDIWEAAMRGVQNQALYQTVSEGAYERFINDATREYSSSNMLNAGWSSTFAGGSLNVNANAVFYEDRDDDYNISISWSKRFGTAVRASSTTSFDKDGFERNVNNIGIDHQFDNWSSNLTAGVAIEGDGFYDAELSGTVNGSNDALNGYVYAYHGRGNTTTLSGGLTNTQIISAKGIDFTNRPSDSYLFMNKQVEPAKGSTQNPAVYMGVAIDEKFNRSYEIAESGTAVPLKAYKVVGLHADDLGARYNVSNSTKEVVSLPGTVHDISVTVREMEEVMVVFDDVLGSPIDTLTCVGAGCRIEKVSDDGIFRVSYHSGTDVRLISRSGVCLSEPKSNSRFVHGRCLPGLGEDDIEQSPIFTKADFTYIGAYSPSEELGRFIDDAQQKNANIIHVEVAGLIHIYLDLRDEVTYGAIIEQQVLVDGLLSFKAQFVNDYLTKVK